MRAQYDFRRCISGFDFFPWLVMAAGHGYTEVVFRNADRPKTEKWPLETTLRRIQSICVPGVALAGLPHSFGSAGKQTPWYHQSDLVKLCQNGFQVPRLKSVLPPGTERYTVTLRRTQRAEGRNSRESDWVRFAREIGARVIPDYDDEPIHLHDRMALYAGAEMNFFVTNGPVMLCFLSEYPAMGFDVQNSPMMKFGIPYGEPYPFLLPQHRQIYEADTYENISRTFEAWQKEKGK